MKTFRMSKKVVLPCFFVTIILLTMFLLVWGTEYLTKTILVQEISTTETEARVVKNPAITTYAFLGVDSQDKIEFTNNYLSGHQADSIMVLVLDHNEQSYSVLQINRDTMVDVPVLDIFGKFFDNQLLQIAIAYSYGDGLDSSSENTVAAIENLLQGEKINYFFTTTIGAIPILNDMVGGVTVTIEDDFSENDPSLVMGETITLNGEQAKSYLRGRMTVADGTNENRMKRQLDYLTALYEKMQTSLSGSESDMISSLETLEGYYVTNCSVNVLSLLQRQLESYTFQGFVQMEGSYLYNEKTDFMEFYLDETSQQDVINDLFYVTVE